jgi:hypothetical protein
MTAFLYFEPSVPMVVLTVYEPCVVGRPEHENAIPATRRHSPPARCLAWLLTLAVRLERWAD